MVANDVNAYTDARLAEFYDVVTGIFWPGHDVSYYLDQVVSSGGPVLDLAAGTGRVALPIARAGLPVTALDAAPAMLEVLRQKVACRDRAVPAHLKLVTGRMEDFNLDERFKAVILAFNSFGHLVERRTQEACIECVSGHLLRGGRFYLHLAASFDSLCQGSHTPFGYSERDGAWIACDDRFVRSDRATGLIHLQWVYEIVRPGLPYEKAVVPLTMKYTSLEEITGMLKAAGLTVIDVLTEWRGVSLGDDANMIVARK